jgi:hypothetical protein
VFQIFSGDAAQITLRQIHSIIAVNKLKKNEKGRTNAARFRECTPNQHFRNNG